MQEESSFCGLMCCRTKREHIGVQSPRPKFSVFNAQTMSATHDVTRLLAEWAKGNQQALDDLTPLVYKELRQLAAGYLRKERQGHTLQPTALIGYRGGGHRPRYGGQPHPRRWQVSASFGDDSIVGCGQP